MVFSWEEMERESGIQVLFRTGGILFSKKKQEGITRKYANAMAKYNIP